MLKRFFIVFLFLIVNCQLLIVNSNRVRAIVDPLNVPNNKIGVHILDTSEIFQAAKLVNAGGGTWGYVTIPIQINDRNFSKWSQFFNKCRENKVIPILRLATYFSGSSWVAPTSYDLIDFANFLSDLPWPTKNRYVILFNEPNHSKEWGGYLSPNEYANLLVSAHEIFKTRSQDFYLISAGLDMSAPGNATSQDALRYYRDMTRANPAWFAAVDGLAVHAYPNPAFTASPRSVSRYGITSYRHELAYLKLLGFSDKPLFITETGFLGTGPFFTIALTEIWTDKNIVTITPFVLYAGSGEFVGFSLLDPDAKPKNLYNEIYSLTKTPGSPLLSPAASVISPVPAYFSATGSSEIKPDLITRLVNLITPQKPILHVGRTEITVEIRSDSAGVAKGLSGRANLPKDQGMLFMFPQSALRTFWMKDMNFALDFIWIDHGQIVNMNENVPPPAETNSQPVVLSSGLPAQWVLEVESGFIKNHQLQLGDPVVLNSP